MQTYVLGGGCYWCLDAAFRGMKGIQSVVSGFSGGLRPHPSYEQVCTGATGHAEVVSVTFDEAILPEEIVLDAFFTMHDPRQLNRQGNDVGTQYRSVMFYADDEQRQAFEAARVRASDHWDGDVVTAIEPLTAFYPGPEDHQDFFAKNPDQGYCLAVALPKAQKVRASFAEYF